MKLKNSNCNQKKRNEILFLALLLMPCVIISFPFQPSALLPTPTFHFSLHGKGSYENENLSRVHPKRFETKIGATETTPSSSPKKKKRRKRKRPSKAKSKANASTAPTWRLFGIQVHPDALGSTALITKASELKNSDAMSSIAEKIYLNQAVITSLCQRLKIDPSTSSEKFHLPKELADVRVIRRSLDARKKFQREGGGGPKYTYVVDVDLTPIGMQSVRMKHTPGRCEKVTSDMEDIASLEGVKELILHSKQDTKPIVIIVGAGPCGLFCALELARSNLCTPILLERGQAVEGRGKDIGALLHRKIMNSESNFAFGEGGAGTWSDGKLTTRIGRNSKLVRQVLETFVEFGAPNKILVDGSPHLGTDNLVRLLRNMRNELRELGGQVLFGAKMEEVLFEGDVVSGVRVCYSKSRERGGPDLPDGKEEGNTAILKGDVVVLATGHSARDVYESLHDSGIQLEAKGFAAGFRIEHPQKIINKIQYGNEWGAMAYSGREVTDNVNKLFFTSNETLPQHEGRLPVSSYRLATDKAFDGETERGAYSFCMCPGGQIVPASTDPDSVCVNGMSFSRRDSIWANAALVVTVAPNDPILVEYREKHGILAGIAFQRDMERKAAIMGGGDFTVPVQRLTDFIENRPSENAPSSSYRLGVKPSACHELFPAKMTKSLQDAVVNHFEKQMPGFLCDEALLHGVEMRTSSPVRITRDPETLQSIGKFGLFPAGEGAGFAGGIVSAAVDGLSVGEAILEVLTTEGNSDGKEGKTKKQKSVGFDY